MDEFSDKEVKMTYRELTFIKAAQYDKGWRWGFVRWWNVCSSY